jgi:hypothetical protein
MKQLKHKKSSNGYYSVGMATSDETKQKRHAVHVSVARALIPNPNDLPVVNHIDGDKSNNRQSNLEWVSHKRSVQHAFETGLIKSYVRPVVQADADGNLIAEFQSIKEASKATGISSSTISAVCIGRKNQRFAGGSVWYFKENYVSGKKVRKFGNCKTVLQFTIDGDFVQEFESAKAASLHVDCKESALASACRGDQDTCMGFTWKYQDGKTQGRIQDDQMVVSTEDWAVLVDYPNYKISRDGQIFSTYTKRVLKCAITENERIVCSLKHKNENKAKRLYVHRLVAMAYLPNPDNHPKVNHLDGNPLNNHVDNLEWASYSRDSQHAYDTGLNPNKKAIIQYGRDGTEIHKFTSTAEAARSINGSKSAITLALTGKTKTSGGFIWRRVGDDTPVKPIPERIYRAKPQPPKKTPSKTTNRNRKAVIRSDLEGNFLEEYESLKQAADTSGANIGSIARSCKGTLRQTQGFLWSFKTDYVPGRGIRKKKGRPVEQYTIDDEYVKTFSSAAEAAEELGCKDSPLAACCNDLQQTCMGFKWKWAELQEVVANEYADWIVLDEFPNYRISSDGQVYSKLAKKLLFHVKKGRWLTYGLMDSEKIRKTVLVHRLVAAAHLPNPDDLPMVIHKDGVVSNNHVDNLQWSSQDLNTYTRKVSLVTNKRAVVQFDKTYSRELARFDSIKAAADSINTPPPCISQVLSGKAKTAKGFGWRYVDTE